MRRVRDVLAPSGRLRRPTLAERARTTLAVAPVVEVFARGRLVSVATHEVRPGGQVALDVDPASPLVTVADREYGTVLVLVRAARLRCEHGPDRVRTRVELLGRMASVRAGSDRRVLVVEPRHVSVDDLVVSVRRYRRATADPLAAVETDELRRLAARPDELARLCTLLGDAAVGAKTVVPVGLDRYGLTLRITGCGTTADHRLAFPSAVADPGRLCEALRGAAPQPAS